MSLHYYKIYHYPRLADKKMEGCFNRILSGFQEVLCVFEESFKVVRVFQRELRGIPRYLQGRFKGVSRVSKRS